MINEELEITFIENGVETGQISIGDSEHDLSIKSFSVNRKKPKRPLRRSLRKNELFLKLYGYTKQSDRIGVPIDCIFKLSKKSCYKLAEQLIKHANKLPDEPF